MSPNHGSRNRAPRFGLTRFWLYLGGVTAAGLGLAGWQFSNLSFRALPIATLTVVGVLLLLSELRPLMAPGSPDENGVTVSTAFVFALLLHWGLPLALLLQSVTTVAGQVLHRRAPWRAAFNVAQYALSWAAAAATLWLAGRGASPAHPLRVGGGDLPAVLAAAAVFFVTNDVLVSRAVAFHHDRPLREVVFGDLSFHLLTEGALLALGPIVVVVMERGPGLVPLLLLPIAAVYATASVSREREHQAYHDALTGLPNRKLLLQRAGAAIEESRLTGRPVALALLDLDRFKEVNDTLGHAVGDALLQIVSRRLHSTLRPEDTVARLGGDEFAVLLPAVPDEAFAHEVATRLRSALAEPFTHDGITFDLEASVGLALHPQHAADFDSLMQRADVAMYLAKEAATGVEVYSLARDRHSATRLALLGDLRRALDEGELEVHYQPKVVLATGEVDGMEALLRWRHPRHGVLAPGTFLTVAARSGLMTALTRFVVRSALDQAAWWAAAGLPARVAVNVSARDLHDSGLPEHLEQALAGRGLPADALSLEVTEHLLMADPARAAGTLQALAARGVRIALDDFGTGYSSLVHLRRLPVSEVKVDRSFVQHMDRQPDDAVIVRSIVEMGVALGLRVVAEGVESAAVRERLVEFGCDAVQGDLISPPLPAEAATRWLAAAARSLPALPAQARPA